MADWACDYGMANDTGTGLTAWANAKKTLKAVTDLCAAGDTIYVHVGTDQVVTVDTTWTIPAGVRILASNDTANFPPTVLSTSGGIISPTAGVDYTFNGGPCSIKGFRLKPGASTSASIIYAAQTSDDAITFEDCYFDLSGTTSASQRVTFGSSSATVTANVSLINCQFKFGATGGGVGVYCPVNIVGGGLESGSSIPTVFFLAFFRAGSSAHFTGFDFSGQTSGTVFSGATTPVDIQLSMCKLGAATLTSALAIGGIELHLYDCSSTDTHYHIAHYSYTGSTTVSTAIYCNDGAEYNIAGDKCSWVVAGNANTSRANPYTSPWFSAYNEAASAITPYIEILRDGSATAFTDIQIAGEWMLKTVGGSPLATLYSDYGGHLSTGTAQGNGVGLSGWTGESGTAWSGRLQCPSVTPAEIGHVSMRVVVYDNIVVYADPLPRGL